jgi:hypothetical protein
VTYDRQLTEEEIEIYIVDACASARTLLKAFDSTEVYCTMVPVSSTSQRRLLAATQYILFPFLVPLLDALVFFSFADFNIPKHALFCRYIFSVFSTASTSAALVPDEDVNLLLSALSIVSVGDMKPLTTPTAVTPEVVKEKVQAINGTRMDSPVIGGVYPELVPFGGGITVALKGKNLGQIRDMTVTDLDGGETPIDGELVFTPSSTFIGETDIKFRFPSINTSGYHKISILINQNGAVDYYTGYYTMFVQQPNERQECIQEGEWKWDAEKQSCVSCPKNAYCPGGGRIWPEAG